MVAMVMVVRKMRLAPTKTTIFQLTRNGKTMMKGKYVAAIFCAALILGGCDNSKIASVDGRDITQEEFNAYLKFKRIPEQDKARVDRALDDYLQRAALTAAIEKTDTLDTDLVQAELEEFRRQMIIGRYFEEQLNKKVDDVAVRNFYSSNPTQFEAKRIHAAHILIRVDEKMSETERQAKMSSAHDAFSRLQKGEDFAAVAKAVSEDKVSGEKGGDLGWLAEGAVDSEFSKRLFETKVGEVSEPFLTVFGYHILKVIEGPEVVKQSIEAVEGNIRYQLRNETKLAETERLLKSIKVNREN
jgi:peptidyl-prolyl cis-trans isomerase C